MPIRENQHEVNRSALDCCGVRTLTVNYKLSCQTQSVISGDSELPKMTLPDLSCWCS